MRKTSGAVIAAAVVSLFAGAALAKGKSAPPAKPDKAAPAGGQVKCGGVNECKGRGSCGNAKHDCAGYNDCRGKGWVMLPENDCLGQGGTIIQ